MSEFKVNIVPPAEPTLADLSSSDTSKLLAAIEWRAYCLANNAAELCERRDFYTAAEDEMLRAEKLLTQALSRVKDARRTYSNKPVRRNRAA